MIERIAEIQGIGLLHQATGKPYTCQKATLIYADNGRGKSTVATILRSVSTGVATLIIDRKTVDGTLAPKVVLQFDSGHKVLFDGSTWSEQRPEVLVFDMDFVERNVYSGGTVNTVHRKNLLEFALGEEAVAARIKVNEATTEAKAAADKVQNLVAHLSGHHIGITLTQFEKLPQVANIDNKIEELQKRINAANNVAAILAKPVPSTVSEPSFDIEGLFAELGTSLKNVHADAESVVRQHIAKLGGKIAENWLSQGLQFSDTENCPYCGQDTSANDLIRAYQTHFDASYNKLKVRIATLHSTAEKATSSTIIDGAAQAVAVADAQTKAWAEHVQTQPISFEADVARTALAAFQNMVFDLTQKKIAALAESLGGAGEKDKASSLWQEVVAPIKTSNSSIKMAIGLITTFKGQLTADNLQLLQQQLQNLQMTKRRYDAVVFRINPA